MATSLLGVYWQAPLSKTSFVGCPTLQMCENELQEGDMDYLDQYLQDAPAKTRARVVPEPRLSNGDTTPGHNGGEHHFRYEMMSSRRLGEYAESFCVFLVGVW